MTTTPSVALPSAAHPLTTLSISATAAAVLPKLNSRSAVTPRTLGLNTGPATARSRLQTTVVKRSAARFHVGFWRTG